jgi:diguanylate cyclase (GGDEF)-like protein
VLRMVICDDSPDVRESVKEGLAGHDEIEIVGEAANGEEAVALAAAKRPDVVLMDIRMPVLDGIAATRRIHELLPKARIVAYAGSDDSSDVMAMIGAGADAYCVKGAPFWELERVVAGASDPLVRLAHALARSINGGGAAELVARELADLTGAAFAACYLATAGDGLSLSAMSGPAAARSLQPAPGLVLRAFAELRLAQADVDELGELHALAAPCGGAVGAPLLADGQALGALLVAMPANVDVAPYLELVAAVADLASASLANERRLALTHAEARRDALTGLANRRAFDEYLDAAFDQARAERELVSIALFDLDGFKEVNDREGHLVGDQVLCEVGRVLMRVVRADDEVFRIGGEEFAVVIGDGWETAARVADRVRAAIAEQRRGHPLPSASAGIATFPLHASSPEDLVDKADVALYAAKRTGKNRVQVFDYELTVNEQPRKLQFRRTPVTHAYGFSE